MNILITGQPGSGKTTLLNKIKGSLESKGYIIGGVYCPEIRKNTKRIGFSIIDIMGKKKGILSHINCSGPRVSKYKVNLKDLNGIGVTAIEKAIEKVDYIFIDEIAPMELYSEKFMGAVETAFNHQKPVLAVIHQKSNHPFILKIKSRNDVFIFGISPENKDLLHYEILNALENQELDDP